MTLAEKFLIVFFLYLAYAGIVTMRQGPFLDPLCNFLFWKCSNTTLVLEGTTAQLYTPVINHYLENFVKNEDLGGSLAVFVDGKPVVDVHAGFKDLRHNIPYDNQTLNQVYSTGQVIESILVAQLVDKGLLDYDENIATYWPEFAQNGKDNVRLQDLMMHQAGVHYIDDEDEENALEWAHSQDRASWADRLARQKHHFRGKPKRAYHAITRGWYLDEIVRRVDPQGRSLEQLAKDELMGPYPDVELYFGQLPRVSDWDRRLSPMHEFPENFIENDTLWSRLVKYVKSTKDIGFPDLAPLLPFKYKIIEEGSLKTNARSLARLMSMMANRGASHNTLEPRLLSKEAYTLATHYTPKAKNVATLEDIGISRGGWLYLRNFYPGLEDVLVQGWGGMDGSLTVWMEELQLGFSFVTNTMGDPSHIFGGNRAKDLLLLAVNARKHHLELMEARFVQEVRGGWQPRLEFEFDFWMLFTPRYIFLSLFFVFLVCGLVNAYQQLPLNEFLKAAACFIVLFALAVVISPYFEFRDFLNAAATMYPPY